MPEIGLFEAINTQRALRRFKPDAVPDDVVRRLLEAATKAPSGSNAQDWHFLVIRDPNTKKAIAEFYRMAAEPYFKARAARPGQNLGRSRESAVYLSEHLAEVPVLILACIQHHGGPGNLARGASIYPAVQNLLLAARGIGLGAVLTTFHKAYEEEIKGLLGIPENVETAALIPLGWPIEGQRYGPTKRKPLEEVTHHERWGGRAK